MKRETSEPNATWQQTHKLKKGLVLCASQGASFARKQYQHWGVHAQKGNLKRLCSMLWLWPFLCPKSPNLGKFPEPRVLEPKTPFSDRKPKISENFPIFAFSSQKRPFRRFFRKLPPNLPPADPPFGARAQTSKNSAKVGLPEVARNSSVFTDQSARSCPKFIWAFFACFGPFWGKKA